MADLLLIPVILLLACLVLGAPLSMTAQVSYLMACPPESESSPEPACSALLYVVPRGLDLAAVASQYAANASHFKAVDLRPGDLLVEVPCACDLAVGNLTALFHSTNYTVLLNDTVDNITKDVFSGLAWGLHENVSVSDNITVRLPCGCWQAGNEGGGKTEVVTYAVQFDDTLATIADLLNSDMEAIMAINPAVKENPNFLKPWQLLFVPMGIHSSSSPPSSPTTKGKQKIAIVILSISISVLFIMLSCLLTFFYRRRRPALDSPTEKSKGNLSKTSSTRFAIAALESQLLACKNTEGTTAAFRSDRPLIFNLEEIDQATENFDDSRKIGEGGYGSVYFGILNTKEVAIKRMRSNMSKEFLAELNVLCKVHHRNVVELIGYATGEDHLYLVYEYVHNGSLNEHLHDPLLKGHQPLSWTARAQIGLDAARGIEYIHDHTKATYVHRDIKTSNILLDSALRAKVADFGLAKLVEHTDEEGYLATRLVGTPGYLPPESVRELQMTTKSDVYAFGVVLAELITGQRALIADKNDPKKMRSLATIMKGIHLSEDPQAGLEEIIDPNLDHVYPEEELNKMVDIAMWCLCDDPVSRPEMREITANLSQILIASVEWEAYLGGNSQVFSGVFIGR